MNLGPYKLDRIYTGDSKELASYIPDESVDLIFTDPIYSNIEDYQWLADVAFRILKPDRACLAWYSKPKHVVVRKVMEPPLDYVYDLEYVVKAKTYRLIHYHIFCWTTPCMWLNKGYFAPEPWVPDTIISSQNTKGKHKWNKNPEAIIRWLDGFTEEGQVVVDFFSGGGVVPYSCKKLNRHWLAFEIDPDIAEDSRERVRRLPLPLTYEPQKQTGLEI